MYNREKVPCNMCAKGQEKISYSVNYKLYRWLKSLGIVLQPGETFNLENLIGKLVVINVRENDKGNMQVSSIVTIIFN